MLATLIALGLAAAQTAPEMPTYPTLPADLAEAAVLFDKAQVTADGKALEKLLAPDYLLINSRDQREDKADFIRDYTTPGFTMEPFTIDDQVIRVWSDGAVLGGVVTMKGMSDGQPYSIRLRFTDIWAKRDGKWQVVFTQANRVQAAK